MSLLRFGLVLTKPEDIMNTCVNCGGYVEPAMKPMHVGGHSSTHFEEVRTQCLSCGTIYIFEDLPYDGAESGDGKITRANDILD